MQNKREAPVSQQTKLLLKFSKQRINVSNDVYIEEQNTQWDPMIETNLLNYEHTNIATSSTETCLTNPVLTIAVFCTESTSIDASTSNLESDNVTEKLETEACISNRESKSLKGTSAIVSDPVLSESDNYSEFDDSDADSNYSSGLSSSSKE